MPGESERDRWQKAIDQIKDWREPASIPEKDETRELSTSILKLKRDDILWKLKARKGYGFIFCLLLFIQNYFIIWLTAKAFHHDQLEDMSFVIGTIITGTLAETAFLIR